MATTDALHSVLTAPLPLPTTKTGWTLTRSSPIVVQWDHLTALHHKSAADRRQADEARARALAGLRAGEIDERDYWRVLDAIAARHCAEVPVYRAVDADVVRKLQRAAERRRAGRWAN